MRKCKCLFCLLVALTLFAVLPTNAFAKADGAGKADGYENVTQTWTETAGDALSGKSDFYTRDLLYDKATNKQFITVQGRDGHIFYIVIDYDAQVDEDEEKYMVYFLNQVDESDLSALVEMEEKAPAVCSCVDKCKPGAVDTSCVICAVNMSECAGKEPDPEPEPDPETEVPETEKPEPGNPALKKNLSSIVIMLVMLLAGGGAVFYMKFFKKKTDVSGNTDLDEYDYGDEDSEDPEDGGWEDEDPEDNET